MILFWYSNAIMQGIGYLKDINGREIPIIKIEESMHEVHEFNLDIIFEEGNIKRPKIIGKVINKNKPKSFLIDFYSNSGKLCGRYGREINADFNDMTLISDINFNGGLNDANINSLFNSDEYDIHTKFYEQKEVTEVRIIGGIKFNIPTSCQKVYIDLPEGEKEKEIVASKIKNINETYTY